MSDETMMKDGPMGEEVIQASADGAASGTIEELAAERDSWKDKAYRTAAEAENVRKRAAADVMEARQYAVAKFAADVLGVGDNLARALTAPEGNEKALREGVAMTAAALQTMLGRHGVTVIPVKAGDALNPELHQAMSEVASAEHAAGAIVQELQAGFTLHGRLLRPSLVVVAKPQEQGPGNEEQGL